LEEIGGEVITIKVQRLSNTGQVESYLNRAVEQEEYHGFYYRIPEMARITVTLGDGTTEETRCMVNQLGVVTYLPVNSWQVMFHEETGGIRGVAVEY